jgi:type I restriction enzyme R subunit
VRSIVAKLSKGEAPDSAQMNAKVREMISEGAKIPEIPVMDKGNTGK